MTKVLENPVEALMLVGKENTELHEELATVQRQLDWFRRGLTYISQMPNQAGPVATKVLQFRPWA